MTGRTLQNKSQQTKVEYFKYIFIFDLFQAFYDRIRRNKNICYTINIQVLGILYCREYKLMLKVAAGQEEDHQGDVVIPAATDVMSGFDMILRQLACIPGYICMLPLQRSTLLHSCKQSNEVALINPRNFYHLFLSTTPSVQIIFYKWLRLSLRTFILEAINK